jgi:sporulation protein YlmC with PRC-barrel domain
MLMKSKELKGYKLNATDGDIGKVEDFFFDDQYWTVRYLVANTSRWLMGRKVLLSPHALDSIHEANHSIALKITKWKFEGSPSIQSDEPASKQLEHSHQEYFGWPNYGLGAQTWGSSPHLMTDDEYLEKSRAASWDPHLRSIEAVHGYEVESSDGAVGKVSDFILDDETWSIRYLIVKTGNWLWGKQVMISPRWIGSVSWAESKVFTTLSREEIRSAPEYKELAAITRDYEENLFGHYGCEGYWSDLAHPFRHKGATQKSQDEERKHS